MTHRYEWVRVSEIDKALRFGSVVFGQPFRREKWGTDYLRLRNIAQCKIKKRPVNAICVSTGETVWIGWDTEVYQ